MTLPKEFVYLRDVDSSIIEDIRYAGHHNFTGRPVPGYRQPRCIVTQAAAEALRKAQREVRENEMSLKVYDAYRPEKAVASFMAWCADPADTLMKEEFYPRMDKYRLIPEGYIAADSMHARGSTVDVTLVPLPVPPRPPYHRGQALVDGGLPHGQRFADNSIDMGCGFDLFDSIANTFDPSISLRARENRLYLRTLMQRHGFEPYDREWWHFSLSDGPFHCAFDFDVG